GEANVTEEQRQPEFGWFRTPLAAGMLSGVAAGAASLAAWCVIFRLPSSGVTPSAFGVPWWMAVQIPSYALMCCGPAIAHRRWKLAGYALLSALALLTLDIMMVEARIWFVRLGVLTPPTAWDPAWDARAAVSGALLGLVLTWLYGYKPYTAWAPLLGAVGGVAVCLCSAMLNSEAVARSGQLSTAQEFAAAGTMLTLIGVVVMVLFPTWAIERAMRKRPPPTLDAAPQNG
ncbi:MAG: hypothetical protein NTW87_20330, partial [Planctomycetota bacterium]|nr:hypothetical protein [Planctomycetota bacterium]